MPETNDSANNQGVLSRIASSVAETVKQAIAPSDKPSPNQPESLSESQAGSAPDAAASTSGATTTTPTKEPAAQAPAEEPASEDESKGILSKITDTLKTFVGLGGPGHELLQSETGGAEHEARPAGPSQGLEEPGSKPAEKGPDEPSSKPAEKGPDEPSSKPAEKGPDEPSSKPAQQDLAQPEQKPSEKSPDTAEQMPAASVHEERERPGEAGKDHPEQPKPTHDQPATQPKAGQEGRNPLAGLSAEERYEKAKEILGEPAKRIGGMRVKNHGESHLTSEDKERARKHHEEHLKLPQHKLEGALVTASGQVKVNPNPSPRRESSTKAVASTYFPPQPTHAIPHKGSSRDETWSCAS